MRKTINIRNKTRLITVINSLIFVIPYIYNTKLLQKSEMRKDIVIELSYKGFS